MLVATLLLVALVLCAIYLTVDRIVDERRRARENRQELEDWHATPKQYEPKTKTKKHRA